MASTSVSSLLMSDDGQNGMTERGKDADKNSRHSNGTLTPFVSHHTAKDDASALGRRETLIRRQPRPPPQPPATNRARRSPFQFRFGRRRPKGNPQPPPPFPLTSESAVSRVGHSEKGGGRRRTLSSTGESEALRTSATAAPAAAATLPLSKPRGWGGSWRRKSKRPADQQPLSQQQGPLPPSPAPARAGRPHLLSPWRLRGRSRRRRARTAPASADVGPVNGAVGAAAAANADGAKASKASATAPGTPPASRSMLTPAKILPPIRQPHSPGGSPLRPSRTSPTLPRSPELRGLAAMMGMPPVLQVASAAVLRSTGAPMTPLLGKNNPAPNSPHSVGAGPRLAVSSPSPEPWEDEDEDEERGDDGALARKSTTGAAALPQSSSPPRAANDDDGWGDVEEDRAAGGLAGGSSIVPRRKSSLSPLRMQSLSPPSAVRRAASLGNLGPNTPGRSKRLGPGGTEAAAGTIGINTHDARERRRSRSLFGRAPRVKSGTARGQRMSAVSYDSDDEAERIDAMRSEVQRQATPTRRSRKTKAASGIAAAAMAAMAAAAPSAAASASEAGGAARHASSSPSRNALRSESRSPSRSRLSSRLGRRNKAADGSMKRTPTSLSSHLAGAAFSFVVGATMANMLGGGNSSEDSDSDGGGEGEDIFSPNASMRGDLPAIRALEPTPSPAPSPMPHARDGDSDDDQMSASVPSFGASLKPGSATTAWRRLSATLQHNNHGPRRRSSSSSSSNSNGSAGSAASGGGVRVSHLSGDDHSAAVRGGRGKGDAAAASAGAERSGDVRSDGQRLRHRQRSTHSINPELVAAAAEVEAAAADLGFDDEVFLRLPNTLRRSSSMTSVARSFVTSALMDDEVGSAHAGIEHGRRRRGNSSGEAWNPASSRRSTGAESTDLEVEQLSAGLAGRPPAAAGSVSASEIARASLSHSPGGRSPRQSPHMYTTRSPGDSRRSSLRYQQGTLRRTSSAQELGHHLLDSNDAATAELGTAAGSPDDAQRHASRQMSRLRTPQQHADIHGRRGDVEDLLEGHAGRWQSVRPSIVSMAEGGSRRESIMVGPLDQPPKRPARAPERLLIHAVTWNMNEQPIPLDVSPLARPANGKAPRRGRPIDMYVVGTQEGTIARRAWELKLQEMLGPKYVLLHSHALMGIQLCVFVRRPLVWFVRDVESAHVATKMGGMLRTKGGVGISMLFNGTRLLFVDSHLAAHTNKIKDRNDNFHTIRRSLGLPKRRARKDFNLSMTAGSGTFAGTATLKGSKDSLQYFNRIFWLGDLNYRVERSRDMAEYLIQNDNIGLMLQYDQLAAQRATGNVFKDFQEAPISFLPTFKYDIGTDNFDSSQKQRVPSWTDRILWSSKVDGAITCEAYNSIPEMRDSDHKPVYGVYRVQLDCFPDFVMEDEDVTNPSDLFDYDAYIKGNQRHVASNGDVKNGVIVAEEATIVRPTLRDTVAYRSAICAVM